MMTRRAARWLRLKGLVGKETLQILRDPSGLLIAFVLPVLLLLLFGYGVSLDANHIRIALVVERLSASSHPSPIPHISRSM
jgi:ABC-2 type transport system permease protein